MNASRHWLLETISHILLHMSGGCRRWG